MLSFLKENGRWIGGAFLLTYASSFGQTFFVSGSAAEWRARFDLSVGDFGLLYTVATLASALTIPFVGRLIDRWSEARLLLIVAPALSLACLTAAYAQSVLMLGVGIFLLRLFGQGMMPHIALTATGRWFAAQRGRAVSLVVLGHQGGEATLPLLAAGLLAFGSWQTVWWGGALFIMAVILPLGWLSFRTPRIPRGQAPAGEAADLGRSWTAREVSRDPVFWTLVMGVLAPPFIGTTIFFHQDYLTGLNGWRPGLVAGSFTVMALTTVTFALICGALVDRFGARRVVPFFLIPLGVSCFMIAGATTERDLYATMMLLGVSYGFSSTLFGSLWPEVYGLQHLGAIRSLILPFMVMASAAGPGLTGVLIDRGVSLSAQFVAMGVYCGGAVLILMIASRALGRRFEAMAAP